LPADIDAGDYIEIGMLGAYGCAMRTGFNGFTAGDRVIMNDEPMATLYVREDIGDDADREAVSSNVIKL
ncbi:MAG: type III PLP-dependent enzyme, partial [Rhizorhabdus sp.]